jgi:hypothetical protein
MFSKEPEEKTDGEEVEVEAIGDCSNGEEVKEEAVEGGRREASRFLRSEVISF